MDIQRDPHLPPFVRLVECPRDAMQGWKTFIPTKKKIEYLSALLAVGFDTLDFGSFVSAKAIPQMADTKEVLSGIRSIHSGTKLLAIVANVRGAEEACAYDEIRFIGFPFSVSESFQHRNTNSSIEESMRRVETIQGICSQWRKELVIYISMAFGNPYGDPYTEEIVFQWAERIAALDVKIISLADTVGLATPEQVFSLTDYTIKKLPSLEIGVHLHSRPANRRPKIDAALKAGCLRFDGALKGVGGCPMANDELVGNMDSELMIAYFRDLNLLPVLNEGALRESVRIADEIFV